MKYILLLIGFFCITPALCQDRCIVFCFDILKRGKTIDNTTIHQKDLKKLNLTFSYLNCGETGIYIDSIPSIDADYSDKKLYDDLGNSSILVMVYNHYALFFHYSPSPPIGINKRKKHIKLLAPRTTYYSDSTSTTDYFKSLPPGNYTVFLQYVDKLNSPQNRTGINPDVDTGILSKYHTKDLTPSAGYFLQYAQKEISFKVIK